VDIQIRKKDLRRRIIKIS